MRLRLHDKTDRVSDIDPSSLTPRARALAEAIAPADANPLGVRHPIRLASDQTMRELDLDPIWYGPDLDQPHTTMWSSWSDYPATSTLDPHEYLETQAAKLPVGYYPTGVDASGTAQDDADLITRMQVIEVMRAAGRTLSVGALDNYRSRPPAGWPGPVRYVGRTPMWSRRAIEAYAANR